ncbi:hypothetical protein BO71DRAFT_400372 [Aspergillus ellipticus CBS 707.79]|uniref:Uncharacterized protein n=1 Tax=Aspergillus ellipticus CBS 707.79 TaxID=1448320 RepID=A0A319D5I1_9EURO|nr:hypothetical protein BO71DRAFT_400372 [Aspergillus ellipticus CBS 707.79]
MDHGALDTAAIGAWSMKVSSFPSIRPKRHITRQPHGLPTGMVCYGTRARFSWKVANHGRRLPRFLATPPRWCLRQAALGPTRSEDVPDLASTAVLDWPTKIAAAREPTRANMWIRAACVFTFFALGLFLRRKHDRVSLGQQACGKNEAECTE